MADLNKCCFIGRLGKDPEVRSFPNGGKVCNITLACGERWRDKASGEQKERTEWVSVAIMAEGVVGIAEKYLRKGSRVYVEGQMQTRKWQDKEGKERYQTEIVIKPFGGLLILLDKAEAQEPEARTAQKEPDASYDDEIPF